jgi:hypothetical protein
VGAWLDRQFTDVDAIMEIVQPFTGELAGAPASC